jgi:hypothetical protein
MAHAKLLLLGTTALLVLRAKKKIVTKSEIARIIEKVEI